jgi:hypothetical protein
MFAFKISEIAANKRAHNKPEEKQEESWRTHNISCFPKILKKDLL